MELKVISETSHGALLHSEFKQGYQLVFKNLIILMKNESEFSEFKTFINKTHPGCCTKQTQPGKQHVFRMDGRQTFLSYNDEEFCELQALLQTAESKIRLIEQMKCN
jgi:hypothetical protein